MKSIFNKFGTDLVIFAGMVSISVGSGMIYFPAGLIVGGFLAIAGAILSIWGEEDEAE